MQNTAQQILSSSSHKDYSEEQRGSSNFQTSARKITRTTTQNIENEIFKQLKEISGNGESQGKNNTIKARRAKSVSQTRQLVLQNSQNNKSLKNKTITLNQKDLSNSEIAQKEPRNAQLLNDSNSYFRSKKRSHFENVNKTHQKKNTFLIQQNQLRQILEAQKIKLKNQNLSQRQEDTVNGKRKQPRSQSCFDTGKRKQVATERNRSVDHVNYILGTDIDYRNNVTILDNQITKENTKLFFSDKPTPNNSGLPPRRKLDNNQSNLEKRQKALMDPLKVLQHLLVEENGGAFSDEELHSPDSKSKYNLFQKKKKANQKKLIELSASFEKAMKIQKNLCELNNQKHIRQKSLNKKKPKQNNINTFEEQQPNKKKIGYNFSDLEISQEKSGSVRQKSKANTQQNNQQMQKSYSDQNPQFQLHSKKSSFQSEQFEQIQIISDLNSPLYQKTSPKQIDSIRRIQELVALYRNRVKSGASDAVIMGKLHQAASVIQINFRYMRHIRMAQQQDTSQLSEIQIQNNQIPKIQNKQTPQIVHQNKVKPIQEIPQNKVQQIYEIPQNRVRPVQQIPPNKVKPVQVQHPFVTQIQQLQPQVQLKQKPKQITQQIFQPRQAQITQNIKLNPYQNAQTESNLYINSELDDLELPSPSKSLFGIQKNQQSIQSLSKINKTNSQIINQTNSIQRQFLNSYVDSEEILQLSETPIKVNLQSNARQNLMNNFLQAASNYLETSEDESFINTVSTQRIHNVATQQMIKPKEKANPLHAQIQPRSYTATEQISKPKQLSKEKLTKVNSQREQISPKHSRQNSLKEVQSATGNKTPHVPGLNLQKLIISTHPSANSLNQKSKTLSEDSQSPKQLLPENNKTCQDFCDLNVSEQRGNSLSGSEYSAIFQKIGLPLPRSARVGIDYTLLKKDAHIQEQLKQIVIGKKDKGVLILKEAKQLNLITDRTATQNGKKLEKWVTSALNRIDQERMISRRSFGAASLSELISHNPSATKLNINEELIKITVEGKQHLDKLLASGLHDQLSARSNNGKFTDRRQQLSFRSQSWRGNQVSARNSQGQVEDNDGYYNTSSQNPYGVINKQNTGNILNIHSSARAQKLKLVDMINKNSSRSSNYKDPFQDNQKLDPEYGQTNNIDELQLDPELLLSESYRGGADGGRIDISILTNQKSDRSLKRQSSGNLIQVQDQKMPQKDDDHYIFKQEKPSQGKKSIIHVENQKEDKIQSFYKHDSSLFETSQEEVDDNKIKVNDLRNASWNDDNTTEIQSNTDRKQQTQVNNFVEEYQPMKILSPMSVSQIYEFKITTGAHSLSSTDSDIAKAFRPSFHEPLDSPPDFTSPKSAGGISITVGGGGISIDIKSETISPQSQTNSQIAQIQSGSGKPLDRVEYQDKFSQDLQDQINQQDLENPEIGMLADTISDNIFSSLLREIGQEINVTIPRPGSWPTQQLEQQKNKSAGGYQIKFFDKKGIKTDLFAIERYVDEILEEVNSQKNDFMNEVIKQSNNEDMQNLHQMQNSEIGNFDHFQPKLPEVICLDMYLKLEKRRKDSRRRDDDGLFDFENVNESDLAADNVDKNFLAECMHIHNKVLFDCINDSLQQFRPNGKEGHPRCWSLQNRKLKASEDFTLEEMFEITKHDLFRMAITQAGTLPRREFVFGGNFDEELFAEIREKKLATLLCREIVETEHQWLKWDYEEAQSKIDIADMVLDYLVQETIQTLNQINH